MSELNEQRWAVMSERGCEATRLAYADAAELVRRLRSESVRGLCVITETAASHLPCVGNGNGRAPAQTSRRARRPARK